MSNPIYISFNPTSNTAKEIIVQLQQDFGNNNVLLSKSLAVEPDGNQMNDLLNKIDQQVPDTSLMITLLENSNLNNECFKYENLQAFLLGIPIIPLNITNAEINTEDNPFANIGAYFDETGLICYPMELINDEWQQYELISSIDLEEPIHQDMRDKVYSLDIFCEMKNWQADKKSTLNLIKKSLG